MAETFYKKLAQSQFFLEKNKEKNITNTPQIIHEELFPEKRMDMKLQFLNVSKQNEPDLDLSLGGSYNKPPVFRIQPLAAPRDKTERHKPPPSRSQPLVTPGVKTGPPLDSIATPRSILPEYYLRMAGFTNRKDKLKIDSLSQGVQGKRKYPSFACGALASSPIPPKLPCNGVTMIARAMEKGQPSGKQTLEEAISLAARCGPESIPLKAGKGIMEASSSSKVSRDAAISLSDTMKMMRQMLTVAATGDSGNTIEGILHPDKRDPVTIECICHGKSLSPAEFVQHAGCKEVTDPMKHITVWPSGI